MASNSNNNSSLNLDLEESNDGATEVMQAVDHIEGFHIAIISSGDAVKPYQWPADQKSIYVGREKEECQIVLHDKQVSRIHLQITKTDQGLIEVTDLGSTNKSYHNHDMLEPYENKVWHFGDIIIIGKTRLILRRGKPN